ncbi:uncharacterized protein LOC111310727 [Durio zibethinus]|uniref:Uncharacterized protein LOC111310727 n=1 Tax=Durio zibethinus TaxID=66656 RepID=A0A6P6AM44_DURZI|nr:uncharacterized protein LOC111310727 [Durio zibethinus]
MPTTIFVALQCCQCSTMQVKQRKKSSNKWTCVVCNQKQSVLKVFAQGPMAKDLRKFVQSFNMSPKFTDQNQPSDPTLEYDNNSEDDDGGDPKNQRKRRTDWTEYLDLEDHHHHRLVLQEEEQGHIYFEKFTILPLILPYLFIYLFVYGVGDDLKPKIVTELPPKEQLKRPKLRNYEIGEGGNHQLYKPVFSKRNSRKDTMLISRHEKPMGQQPSMGEMDTSASKWSDISIGISEKSMRDCKPATAKGNSKWEDYMTEDEGESFRLCTGRRNFADHMNKWGDAVLETESKCQMVEDDIHPDFM